jgi:hypothetical protein
MSKVRATAPLERDPWRTMTLAAGGGVGGAVGWGVAPGCGVGLGRAVGFGVDLGVGLAVGVGATVGRAVAGCPGVGPAVGDAGTVGRTVGSHDVIADGVGSPDDDGDAGPNEHPPSATTRMRTRFEIRRGIGITQSTVGAGARRAYGHRPRSAAPNGPTGAAFETFGCPQRAGWQWAWATPRSYRAVTR